MRTELQPFEGRRVTVTGVFIRFEWYPTKWGSRRKVLLKWIKEIHGRFTTQHASLSYPPDVRAFEGFGRGDAVRFSAIVYIYKKGCPGESIRSVSAYPVCMDYGLREVRDLARISIDYYRKMDGYPHLMQELISHKKISLGVC